MTLLIFNTASVVFVDLDPGTQVVVILNYLILGTAIGLMLGAIWLCTHRDIG